MKVLHVSHGYPPRDTGGIETYLQMVVAAQRSTGHEVLVLAGSTELREQPCIEEEIVDGVPVLRVLRDDWFNDHYAHSYHAGASALIGEALAAHRPDVVHVHQWIRLSADIVAQANGHGMPTVITLHDVYTSCPRAFRVDRQGAPCRAPLSPESCSTCVPVFGHESAMERGLGIELFRDQYRSELAAAGRVLVATAVTADLLHETTGAPRELFTVHDLPYQPRFRDLPRQPPREDTAALRFGYWGSLTPHKGPQILIDAFRVLVRDSDVAAELHLLGPLGPPEQEERLRTAAADLPVTFHGAFDAAGLAAARIDLAVFPVLCFEGFGLGLAEAFELGIPAIVSDIGALAGRIGDAGLRVPPGDVAALADAMHRIATDASLRERLTRAIPGLPIAPEDHVAELTRHYEAVRAAGPRPATPIDAARRARLVLAQRESAHASLRDTRGTHAPE